MIFPCYLSCTYNMYECFKHAWLMTSCGVDLSLPYTAWGQSDWFYPSASPYKYHQVSRFRHQRVVSARLSKCQKWRKTGFSLLLKMFDTDHACIMSATNCDFCIYKPHLLIINVIALLYKHLNATGCRHICSQ